MVREDTNHGDGKIELPRFVSSRNETGMIREETNHGDCNDIKTI